MRSALRELKKSFNRWKKLKSIFPKNEILVMYNNGKYEVNHLKERKGMTCIDYELKDICLTLQEVYDTYGEHFLIRIVLF